MADIPDEELTIGGKRIETLRVVDLKAELKKRGLSNSGTKNQLIKRLKTQVTLEKLQEASQSDVLPSQKIAADETVGANEFIQQYLKQQQELLAQRESLQAAAAAHQADVEQARERKESGSGGGDGSSGTGFGIPAALADQVEELNESLSKQKSVEELSFEDQEKEDSSHGDEEKEKEEEEEKTGDKTDKDAKDIHEEQDNEGKCERSEPEVKVAKEEEPKEPKEEVARQQKDEASIVDVKKKDEIEAVDNQRKQESNLTETDRAGQEKPRQGDRDATSENKEKVEKKRARKSLWMMLSLIKKCQKLRKKQKVRIQVSSRSKCSKKWSLNLTRQVTLRRERWKRENPDQRMKRWGWMIKTMKTEDVKNKMRELKRKQCRKLTKKKRMKMTARDVREKKSTKRRVDHHHRHHPDPIHHHHHHHPVVLQNQKMRKEIPRKQTRIMRTTSEEVEARGRERADQGHSLDQGQDRIARKDNHTKKATTLHQNTRCPWRRIQTAT
ncbi:apoptotic chromatin condensation inducer in the nucleus-like isoform X1 [Ptychodera flava]|uniref:apoptotic chromatin condensation inducer in the nucleus-like isoform X1 n=1 Tax=Ptychodera flava TaxID=63121 RepID=UPI00396A60EC